MRMAFHIYIFECSDGSYYTGHTDNIEKRIFEHNLGLVDGYTSARRPLKLRPVSDFGSREEALEAERQIKGWNRKKKEAFMAGKWDLLIKLSNVKN